MALRRALANRLFNNYRAGSSETFLAHSLIPKPSLSPSTKTTLHREHPTSQEYYEKGFFRRFLHRGATITQLLTLPVGENLREKLSEINNNREKHNRLRFNGLVPPVTNGVTVEEVKKLLKFARVEKLRGKLREMPESSIAYSDFIKICVEQSEDVNQGKESAKFLDECGNVIVLGNIVFLKPDQIAKSIDTLISQSTVSTNDPRREQLEQLEMVKTVIDQKARAQVQNELYFGLGFLILQTIGFMRLTFWELSWDVMEPICFFVTSLHFGFAFSFFLRTSTEPSFEGYFQTRFKRKQQKLMKIHNFDDQKYKELCKLFYPNYGLPNLEPCAMLFNSH
ncbi:hypothetical protein ACFE04_006682 [Oxalis oulophora]